MEEKAERVKGMGNSESPISKSLFSIRNQIHDARINAAALLDQFGRIDPSLQKDRGPSDADLKKGQEFSELTLRQKLDHIDSECSALEKQIVELNDKFQQFL